MKDREVHFEDGLLPAITESLILNDPQLDGVIVKVGKINEEQAGMMMDLK